MVAGPPFFEIAIISVTSQETETRQMWKKEGAGEQYAQSYREALTLYEGKWTQLGLY